MCKSIRGGIKAIADQICTNEQKNEEDFLMVLKKCGKLSIYESIYIMQAAISRNFFQIIDKYEYVFDSKINDLNILYQKALIQSNHEMFKYILGLAKKHKFSFENKDYPENNNNETFLSMALKMYNYQIINYIMEEVGDRYVLNKIEVYRLKDYLRYVKVDREFIKLMFNHLTEDNKVNLFFDLINN